MKDTQINGTLRSEVGQKFAKETRKQGLIPCVLYGGKENFHFTVEPLEVRDIIYTSEFKVINLKLGSTAHRAIVKAIQWHPVKDTLQHLDFLELQPDKKFKVQIPLKFTGTSVGVKQGGKLIQTVRKVDIKTDMKGLVDTLFVDISHLDLGQAVRIRDIKVPSNIEVLNNPSLPIGYIDIPRALKSAASAAAKG